MQTSELTTQLNQILEVLEQNANLRLLMRKVSDASSTLSKFLLINSDLIFVMEELTEPAPDGSRAIRLPVLFWTSLSLSDESSHSLQHLSNMVSLKRESIEVLKLSWSTIFRQSLNEQVMKDLLAYFALKFARCTEQTKTLVRHKRFSFRKMRNFLGNYEGIDADGLFSEIPDATKDKAKYHRDPDVSRLLINMPKQFYRAIMGNISKTVLVDSPLPDIVLDELVSKPLKYVKDMDTLARLTPKEYQVCVNELYDLNLLPVTDSIFWCANREHEPVMMRTKASLSALNTGPGCPKCGWGTDYNAMYQPSPILKEAILFPGGGMLSVLIGWILRQKSLKYQTGVNLEGNEMDFIIELGTETWLVESKMHRSNLDAEALIQACQKDIRKVAKKRAVMRRNKMEPNRSFLVYNWSDRAITEILEKEKAILAKLQEARIQIVGYDVFPNILYKK